MKLTRTILCAAALAFAVSASSIAQTASQSAVYIHAGALLDRPGQAPRGPSTIIVRDGRIEAVRDGLVAPEAGARLVDLGNQFVLPGLIDMQVHMFNDDDKMRAARWRRASRPCGIWAPRFAASRRCGMQSAPGR